VRLLRNLSTTRRGFGRIVPGMLAVLQRVTRAAVSVDGVVVGRLDGPGLVVLVGVTHDDGPAEAAWLARKVRELRIMREERSVADLGAAVLVVSQFTLYGDARKGRRPTWADAAPGPVAEPLYDAVCAELERLGTRVERGVFGADMTLELVNDGPTTILLDSAGTRSG
jgi:D-aminoacyl-tRNA deacylase